MKSIWRPLSNWLLSIVCRPTIFPPTILWYVTTLNRYETQLRIIGDCSVCKPLHILTIYKQIKLIIERCTSSSQRAVQYRNEFNACALQALSLRYSSQGKEDGRETLIKIDPKLIDFISLFIYGLFGKPRTIGTSTTSLFGNESTMSQVACSSYEFTVVQLATCKSEQWKYPGWPITRLNLCKVTQSDIQVSLSTRNFQTSLLRTASQITFQYIEQSCAKASIPQIGSFQPTVKWASLLSM